MKRSVLLNVCAKVLFLSSAHIQNTWDWDADARSETQPELTVV